MVHLPVSKRAAYILGRANGERIASRLYHSRASWRDVNQFTEHVRAREDAGRDDDYSWDPSWAAYSRGVTQGAKNVWQEMKKPARKPLQISRRKVPQKK